MMREFIIQKLGLDNSYQLVAWDPVCWHHCQLPPQQQVTRLKFIFCCPPTNVRKVETKQSISLCCPLCRCQVETAQHMLYCHSQVAQAHRHEAFVKIEDTLIGIKTQPALMTIMLEAVSCPCELFFHGAARHMQEVIDEQQSIGWSLVQ